VEHNDNSLITFLGDTQYWTFDMDDLDDGGIQCNFHAFDQTFSSKGACRTEAFRKAVVMAAEYQGRKTR
jgi:hypothetical protein